MQLEIRSRNLDLAPAARRAMERRLRLALGRHVARVDRARITLTPCERRSGPPSKRCRIAARLREGASIVVEESAPEIEEAAEGATWRLQHFLDRQRVRDLVHRLRS